MLRIALYVEPVIFRNDPYLLVPWLEWLARMVSAQSDSDDPSFAFMSSPWLCRRFLELSPGVRSHPVEPVAVLRPFDMDRVEYGQDLGADRDAPVLNVPLVHAIGAMIADFKPDLILSFTENRYIAAHSPSVRTVFGEMRALPHTFGPGFFLDPSGHQAHGLLVTEAARIVSLDLPTAFETETRNRWQDGFVRFHRDHPDTPDLTAWLRREAHGNPVAMLALQPPDWLTLEGLGERRSPDAMLLSWLDHLPPGWRAVATYHPAHVLPRGLEQAIAEQMPNFLLLPEAWRQGRSEWLMQGMDAVATCSSAVGWAAILAGKPAVAISRSNMGGFAVADIADLDVANTLSPAESVRLFAFLRHRYSTGQDRFLNGRDCAGRLFQGIAAQGKEFFFSDFPVGPSV